MSDKIRILQLGNENWCNIYKMPKYIDLYYVDVFDETPKKPYDLVCVDRELSEEEIAFLYKATKAHTLFVTEDIAITEAMQLYVDCKVGQRIARENIQDFLNREARNYYSKPYGEKYKFDNLAIAQGFSGSVTWNGNYGVTVEGEYGEEFNQIAYWRNNIPIFQGQALEFWLEYEKDDTVEIALSMTQFRTGTISDVQQKWFFSGKELEEELIVDNEMAAGPLFVSLLAKGSGRLEIVALHDRHSRRGHGTFIPGGKRCVTSKREEVFYYFEPGDGKPPLNVYFSGYKTREGFEGYNLMQGMGCPFLLIAEPRLEGGSFYMGTEEYEKALADIIREHMEKLGFSNRQVILSGISMGSCGALYYGCDILPHAMIVGKPLVSLGDMARNERLHRPGGFPTSLDLLNYICGDTDEAAVQRLNDRFWKKFDAVNWGRTKFIMSYMMEDDYDMTAYTMLISHLKADGVQMYGKGIHGRHNDATGDIVSWFISQYEKILYEDFSRRKK